MDPRPLLGDDRGNYRVHVIGNSGSGKTTLGAEVAETLGVPFFSLDELFWQPGWTASTREEFQARIRDSMAQSDKGWVIEGDYSLMGGSIVPEAATDVIWLDPPLVLYFPRIVVRTFLRILGWRPSPECPESWRGVFLSKDSILWWCLTNHSVMRRKCGLKMKEIGVGVGSRTRERKMRRIGGWGEQLTDWLNSVKRMIHNLQRESVRMK